MAPLPPVFIACRVLQDLFARVLPPAAAAQVIYLDVKLHPHPKQLQSTLQEVLDGLPAPALVGLGFGLCGNGLSGVRAGRHTLLVPRVDDCIPLLLGSYEEFTRQFSLCPATCYLSPGWLESGSQPLQEYLDYQEKYGEEKAAWIMDMQYQHFQRLALVTASPADLEKYRRKLQPVAHFCQRWGLRTEELSGSPAYIARLVAAAQAPAGAGADFFLVPPGGVIQPLQFVRDAD